MEIAIALGAFFALMMIPIGLGLLLRHRLKTESKMKKDNFTSAYSTRRIIFMLAASTILIAILILINALDTFRTRVEFLTTNIVVIPLVVLLMFGTLGMIVFKMVIRNNEILIVSPFGKRTRLNFSDITKLNGKDQKQGAKTHRYEIYTKDKVYCISCDETGFSLFMQIVKEKGIPIEETSQEQCECQDTKDTVV